MTATKWWKYGDCPRLACPAKRGQPCRDGHYGRVLKNPHSGRHVVEYLPTERQATADPHAD